MKEFIMAALPWIVMGIFVAVVTAHQSTETEDDAA